MAMTQIWNLDITIYSASILMYKIRRDFAHLLAFIPPFNNRCNDSTIFLSIYYHAPDCKILRVSMMMYLINRGNTLLLLTFD